MSGRANPARTDDCACDEVLQKMRQVWEERRAETLSVAERAWPHTINGVADRAMDRIGIPDEPTVRQRVREIVAGAYNWKDCGKPYVKHCLWPSGRLMVKEWERLLRRTELAVASELRSMVGAKTLALLSPGRNA